MKVRTLGVAGAMMIALAMGSEAWAQTPGSITVKGKIHDFTGPMTPADPAGPWQIDGDWTLTFNSASGTVEILASLNMIRSDNITRQGHTHHLRMVNGQVAPIANGYRFTGTATLTSNGAVAAFSGSPVSVEITANSCNVVALSIKLKVTH